MRSSIACCLPAATLAALVGFQSQAAAQAEAPPELPMRGRDVASFAPPGYRIRSDGSGDFNGDGITDHVVVFESVAGDPDIGPPRVLVVLLGQRGGGLRQRARSDGAAWRSTTSMRGESYFERLRVRGRSFEVTNVEDVNGQATTITSVFRYGKNKWHLVQQREHVQLQYRVPEPPGGGTCRRVHTRPDESCTAGDRSIDYRSGRVTERWTIEAAQDQPPRPPRKATAHWREARKPLRSLEETGDA